MPQKLGTNGAARPGGGPFPLGPGLARHKTRVSGLIDNRPFRMGAQIGDEVEVTVELDQALAAALAADPDTSATFGRMAFTHRQEYARWVAEAKRDETRQRRVDQAVEMIRAGQTRS